MNWIKPTAATGNLGGAAVSIRSLTKRYGNMAVVKDIDLEK